MVGVVKKGNVLTERSFIMGLFNFGKKREERQKHHHAAVIVRQKLLKPQKVHVVAGETVQFLISKY